MSDKNGGTFELDEDMSDFLLNEGSGELLDKDSGKFEIISFYSKICFTKGFCLSP